MSNNSIPSPYPIFTDIDGQPLEDGFIWIGQANLDPQVNPVVVYWDAALTIPAAQPIRTLGGYPSNSGTPARLYVGTDYSIRVMNKNGSTIFTSSANNAFSSAFITFIQNKTGAVERSALSKMRESISLLDFGADPTGATDSTTAWNNFQASSAGRKLIPAGTYLVNSLNRVYPNDVIEDNIQRFPPGYAGTENQSVENSFNQDLASLRVGGSDTTPLNDERNYWRGLPSQNAWGNNADIGLFSVAFNRNGASYATYSTTFGHDCVVYGTAGAAGGAGSCAGDPDGLILSQGYCSLAWGKNVLAAGSKSAAFCEETIVEARAGFAAGYASKATTWILGEDGIGAVAMGREAWALGNESGAYGAYLRSYNGAVLIGSGINPGSPMVQATKAVGLGANVVLPTIEVNPGNGTVGNFGSVTYRGGLQIYGPEAAAPSLVNTVQTLTNGGSGGYGEFHIKPLVAGSIVNGWTVDAGRTGGIVSLYPTVDGTMRLGSASYRPEYIFAVNGTINTSDAREKQQIRELSDKERAVAIRLKSLVRAFKWNSAVEAKGDKARIHIGVIAQDVKAAFEAEGLVAEDYSVLCYDKWEGQEEVRDADGNLITEAYSGGDRYGVRYEPLLAFIIAAL